MHAQVVRFKLQPGKVDEAADVFSSSIFPAAKAREGFQAGYVLVDREADRVIGFSIWETRQQVDDLVASGFFQEQGGKLAALLAAPPEREVYEIAVTA